MPDALQQLQLDIAAMLRADELFAGVQVIVSRPRDAEDATLIQSNIDNALAGLVQVETGETFKGGLAVIIMMSEGEVPAPNVPGPQLELVQTVRVIENPLVNMGDDGTQITAEQGALNVLSALHHWNPGYGVLTADSRNALKEVNLEGRVAYDVRFRRDAGITPRAFVQRPQITIGGSDATITCGTSGAAIYWTENGSTPSPATGTLYTAPIEFIPGSTLRAAAFKTGLRGSDISTKQL
ncbi:MAG: chitobiase/beta-hexosaminidase C-terminal domain-containing protein [Prosthecobacter sp.]|uniref:FN3 associated domain-containing protein n=1 Tax=Prosthecobacter sp. TaxID=1965333 RepID=UPI0025D2640E|nr:FN3 associated domain-containing protein [Prosthecobacter sp.]MCF7785562.1 chitobiase/beta-hexosaminidase C-terminal domain-containing protein [Prosthecobacter sp.]